MKVARKLPDWLDGYMEYTSNTESTTIYHKWVGLSCIAAALQRKCWFKFGMFDTFPNLYIVLVSEPGIGRKTKAISIGRKLLNEIQTVQLGASVIASPQALFMEMEAARQEAFVGGCDEAPSGSLYHCSLTLMSDELEPFLGNKGENSKMIAQLTDFYDCADRYDYKSKQSGNNEIRNLWLNLLAATTPSSLAMSFPQAAIGGGLSRRMIFIWGSGRAKVVPIPRPQNPLMQNRLAQDLYLISTIAGPKKFSPESEQWWIDWYTKYCSIPKNKRICTEENFDGWYAVKPTLVQKVAMLTAASERDFRHLQVRDFERAVKLIEEAEEDMGLAFGGVGRSEYAADIKQVEKIIQHYGTITEEMLFQIIWKDIDQSKFEVIFPTIQKKGTVERKYKRKESGGSQWVYTWLG